MRHFETIEELIKAGQIAEAQSQLLAVDVPRLTRLQALTVAKLHRRVGQPFEAVRLLCAFVRSKNKLITPTEEELIEYAGALSSIGGGVEAIEILSDAKLQENQPRAKLIKAIAHFTQWEYRQAVPLLESFIGDTIAPYQAKIGRVNLVAALLASDALSRVKSELDKLIPELLSEGSQLLAGNCYELLAQYHLQCNELSDAKRSLEHARTLVSDKKMPDILFILKWEGVLALRENSSSPTRIQKILEARRLAEQFGHWETLRDIDFHLALYEPSPERLAKAFFGTPFASFRTRILKSNSEILTHQYYTHNLVAPVSGNREIQLSDRSDMESIDIKAGSTSHKILLNIARDFYRPLRLATLFSLIYPGQYFDPESSVNRVSVAISRLRKTLYPSGLDIEAVADGGFRLRGDGRLSLKIKPQTENLATCRQTMQLQELKMAFPNQEFSCAEAAKTLKVDPRTALRILNGGLKESSLVKTGQRRGARYRTA